MADGESIDSQLARLQEAYEHEKQRLENLKDDFMEIAENINYDSEPPEDISDIERLRLEDARVEHVNQLNIKRSDMLNQYCELQRLHQELDQLQAQKKVEDAIKNVKEKEGANKKAEDGLKKITPSYKRKRVTKWIVLALCGLALLGSPLVPGLLGATTGLLASSLSMLSTGALSVVGIFALYKFQEVQDKNKKEGMLMGFWNWLKNKEGPYEDAVKGVEKSKKDLTNAQKDKDKSMQEFENVGLIQKRNNPEDYIKRGIDQINGLYPVDEGDEFGANAYWKDYYISLMQKLAINDKLTRLAYKEIMDEAIENVGKPAPEHGRDPKTPAFWRRPRRVVEREAEGEERTA